MELEKIENLIAKLASFIESKQGDSGHFLSAFIDENENAGSEDSPIVFTNALILSCFARTGKEDGMAGIKAALTGYLKTQKSPSWSFNYWERGSEESAISPYPDDLDDTFCALSALELASPGLIDGAAMASIVKLLTTAEAEAGGPYRTWLVDERADAAWRDVDLAVNSNVAYFLSLKNVSLPDLDSFIESRIRNTDFSSPFYPSWHPIVYFISRYYKGELAGKLSDFIISERLGKGGWGNPLKTALAVISLLNLGESGRITEDDLGVISEISECAKAFPFHIDSIKDGKKRLAGSGSLTASFCIEALTQYREYLSRTETDGANGGFKRIIREAVIGRISARSKEIGGGLGEHFLSAAEKISDKDKKGEIILFPFYFLESLACENERLETDTLTDICLASLCGWLAYSAYDDFLYGEGDTRELPPANLALREVVSVYDRLFGPESGFRKVFKIVMDRMEAANFWEVENCRTKADPSEIFLPENLPLFADRRMVYEKSFGHALGAYAVYFSIFKEADPKAIGSIARFFKYYLLARQLNDDVHDWEKDLWNGRISSVGAGVVAKWQEGAGKGRKIIVPADMQELQNIFWNEIIDKECALISENVNLAKDLLQTDIIFKNPEYLHPFLDPLESAVKKALKEREDVFKFVEAY